MNSSAPEVYKDISISNFTLNAQSAINVGSGATNVTLEDLILEGSTLAAGYGINTRGVQGLTINNIEASGFRDGISVGGGNNTIVTNSYFHDLGRNGMSFFQSSGNIYVYNNNIENAEYGVFFGGGVQYIEIAGNTISNMSIMGLGIIKSCNDALIENNIFNGNNIGIVIKANDTQHGEPTTLNNITISGNTITDSYLFGILLENILQSQLGKELTLNNNTFSENGWRYAEDVGGDWWNSSDNSPTTGGSGWENEIGNSYDVMMNYYNASESEPVTTPKLTMDSSISTSVVTNGAKLIYTLTVKNIGNGSSGLITIDNGILSSIANTVVTYKSTGSFTNNKWTINSLGAGDTASLVLETTTKKSGTQNIISTLKTSTQNDTKSSAKKLTVNKDIKLSSNNALSATKVKKNKYVTITTKISNTGLDNSSKFTSKISTTSGLKIATISKSSDATYNKNTKTWTVKSVPSKKTITLKMKVKATKTGTQKIKVTTNGKSQTKIVKVVK